MSHAATKWAFDQPELHRDMKPSEWAVLMVLADCHNPVNGCFPSQDYICSKTNLTERAVRDQLARLRDRNLIDWEAAREGGRRGSNRYRLGFEADFQPAKSAGSAGGEATGKIEQDQPANSDSFNRQNLPPNLVREPVREPEREDAGAREDGQPEEAAALERGDDRRTFEKRVKQVGKGWPGWEGSSTAWTVNQFEKLDESDRQAGERYAGAYLARCRATKVKPVSLGVFFRDRKWTDLPASALVAAGGDAKPDRPAGEEIAPPFGPLWAAARMKQLVTGPKAVPDGLTFIERQLVAEGKADEAALMRAKQARSGWPMVNFMHQRARSGMGVQVAETLLPLVPLMHAVPVGSDLWEAWEEHHKAMGWPWLPDPGKVGAVHFPAGGPERLSEFEAAVSGGTGGQDGDERAEAAE